MPPVVAIRAITKNATCLDRATTIVRQKPGHDHKRANHPSFAYDRDFYASALSYLPPGDPNNPQDQALVELQTFHSDKWIQSHSRPRFRSRPHTFSSCILHAHDVVHRAYHHYQDHVWSKRHKLLRAREITSRENHALAFRVPIPLSEHLIGQEPIYLDILRPEVKRFHREVAVDAMDREEAYVASIIINYHYRS